MSSRSSSTLYCKSNSLQRPGIPGRSVSFDPVKMIPGAYPEDCHTTYPSTPHPKQHTTHKLKDAVQGDVTTVKREFPTLSKTSPDVLPLESFGDMKISDKPITLPSALQDEYYSFATHNIDDDPLDLNDVVYVDSLGMVVPERRGEKRSLEVRDFKGDYASDRAKGGYVPGDGSAAVDRLGSYEEGDIAVGHGGVTYNRFGRGGILPGYPTQEGISKLIIDRMIDDRLRLSGVDKPTSSVPAAISRSTNSSEGFPTSLPSTRNIGIQDSGEETGKGRTVPCLDFRIIEERRESPIFETDRRTAPGNFEVSPKSTKSDRYKTMRNDFPTYNSERVRGFSDLRLQV